MAFEPTTHSLRDIRSNPHNALTSTYATTQRTVRTRRTACGPNRIPRRIPRISLSVLSALPVISRERVAPSPGCPIHQGP